MEICTSKLAHTAVGTTHKQLIVKYIIRKYLIDFNENVQLNILPIECMLKKGIRIEKKARELMHSLSSVLDVCNNRSRTYNTIICRYHIET